MKKIKLITTLSIFTSLGAITPIIMSTTSCNKTVTLSDADKLFLNNINIAISALDFEGVPFKAVHAAKNAGYALFEYKFSNPEFELALNMNTKKYCVLYCDTILNADSTTITDFNKNTVWKFVEKYDPNCEYAQHLNDNFKWDSNETLEVTGSLDTGTNTNVKKIKYVGTSVQKTTFLRTYTEFLTIEPKTQDEISHYHYANNVFLNGCGSSHYHEYGRSCYLQAKNTKLSFNLTKAQDEPCAVDVFEPVDGNVEIVEQHKYASVYTKAGSMQTKGTTLKTVYDPLTIQPVESITELDSINEKCLVRLTANIEVADARASHWTIGTSSTPLRVILDLNGHSIITPKNSSDSTLITVANGLLVLIDSAGPTSEGSIQGSQTIAVESVDGGQAQFIIDGGVINFNLDLNQERAAVTVGNKDTASNTSYKSEFYLYGGQINANDIKLSDNSAAYAIKTFGKGTYTYFVYGQVCGFSGAVVTDNTVGSEGAEIEVFGGDFSSSSAHICINLRNQTKFTVYGGCFIGGTCIGNVNSEVTLNGGVFNANGIYSAEIYKDNYLKADGSVIACYWAKDGTDTAPNIVSNNVKMYSSNGHILHLGSSTQRPIPTTKTWMEFISGCYYFNGSVHKEECNAGMLYDEQTYLKFDWLQKGLWNNQPIK